MTPEIVECLLEETNRCASLYLILHKKNLNPTSDYNAWPKEGITKSKMMLFLALTYYMGIVKKDSLRPYWTIDSVSFTPFRRSVISRCDFLNILAFLYCSNPSDYIPKGQPGYNPKKKLGKILPLMQNLFKSIWIPRREVSMDEGTIPFKGRVSFKVYNPNKPDKYKDINFVIQQMVIAVCLMFMLVT